MERVVSELTELNKKADVIIGIMKKPEKKAVKILEIMAAAAGVLSVLGIIDVIRNWLGF